MQSRTVYHWQSQRDDRVITLRIREPSSATVALVFIFSYGGKAGGNKNDVMDARAIWMAVQQPGSKTEEQQSVLVLPHSRRQLVKFQTARIIALHGTLLEFGETHHKESGTHGRVVPPALELLKTKLPPYPPEKMGK